MEKAHISDFLIGMSMGAATALLFAPYSGTRMRARVTEAATSGAADVKDCCQTVSHAVLSVIDKIAQHRDRVADAIKRGAQAYKQAIS